MKIEDKEKQIMNIIFGIQNNIDILRDRISHGDLSNLNVDDFALVEHHLIEMVNECIYSGNNYDYDSNLSISESLDDFEEELYFVRGQS
jgi:hypothetical protein